MIAIFLSLPSVTSQRTEFRRFPKSARGIGSDDGAAGTWGCRRIIHCTKLSVKQTLHNVAPFKSLTQNTKGVTRSPGGRADD